MRAMDTTGRWGRAAIAVGSLGALLFAVGCSLAREAGGAQTQAPQATAAASQTGLPVVVSCEPTQRTVVRPTMVNGAAMSQVECVPAEQQQPVAYAPPLVQSPAAQPLATPIAYRTAAPQRLYRDMSDTEIVPVASSTRPVLARQVVPARQVIYDGARAQRRTVKKSAIIIGSSTGVGAGVGAAVGGKKGALIGAVIGGGGAALWDQVTRRKD
jgi:hypothetical protein